ncbi:MAG: hypothetical protein IJL87_00765 [Clostridia bacterium]|nr:hypothetical protein [Clostridia bacterium]
MAIVYKIKQELKDKKKGYLGLKQCESCGELTENYLARKRIKLVLFWVLPVLSVPVGRFQHCKSCDEVTTLSRSEWKTAKTKARTMPKRSTYMKIFNELKELVASKQEKKIDGEEIYKELAEKIKIKKKYDPHIRELIATYFAFLSDKQAKAKAAEDVAEKDAQKDEENTSDSRLTVENLTENIIPDAVDKVKTVVRKKTRLLWLLLAIPLLPLVIFFCYAAVANILRNDSIGNIIICVLLFIVPTLLEIKLFSLALKKTKKIKKNKKSK